MPQSATRRGKFALRSALASFTGAVITFFAQLITAVQAEWRGSDPMQRQRRIYFANHASNGDFILIWAVLPQRNRRRTRPVAGADYWEKSPLRRFIGEDVFNAVLIDRNPETRRTDPIAAMSGAVGQGASLIIFPEGTRNQTEEPLLPFKTGIYHLARARPEVEFVPVWIENLNRVMPKGEIIPVPIMCKVIFGPPMHLGDDESKDDFLTRTRNALLALRPTHEANP